METNILQKVKQDLADHKGSWSEICKDTGICYSWLSKLASGVIKNPGVLQIICLAEYFNKSRKGVRK